MDVVITVVFSERMCATTSARGWRRRLSRVRFFSLLDRLFCFVFLLYLVWSLYV